MRQLYKNISFTSLHQIFVTLLAFVLVPLATRYLGAKDYGLYTLATTIGFFIGLAADLGLSTIVTREISKNPRLASAIFGRVLGIKLMLTILAAVLFALFLIFAGYDPRSNQVIATFAVSSLIGSYSMAAFGVFRGIQKMQYEAIGVSMDKVLSVSLGILVLLLGYDIRLFIWSFVVSSMALFAYSFFILYTKILVFHISFRKWQNRIILGVSVYLGISAFLSMAYNYLDILMLSKMGSMDDIGYYSAAYRILLVTRIFPTILATAFLPQFAEQHDDKEKLATLFQEGAGYLLLVILPLIPGAFYLADPIMTFICGPEFATGGPALRILAFATGAQMLNILFVPLYIAINDQRKIVHFQLVGLLLNIVLNLILIPVLSFIGAAIATVATEMIILLLIFIWIRKRLEKPLLPDMIYFAKVAACTVIMMMFVVIAARMKIHVLPVIILAILIYLTAIFLTKTFDLALIKKRIAEPGTS